MTTTTSNPVAQPIPNLTRGDSNAHHYDYSSESPHNVEQEVRVFLRLSDDGTRWIADSPTMDGYPLTSAHRDGKAHNGECACERRDECNSVRAYADTLPLPTGRELIALLIDALPR